MSTMCQLCGLEQTTPENDNLCKFPFCKECEQRNSASSLNGEYPFWNASKKADGFSPYITPLISPALSQSSYGSCVASCDDIQAHMNAQTREYGAEGLDTGQNHSSLLNEHVAEDGNGSLLEDTYIECYANSCSNGPSLPVSVGKDCTSGSLALEECNDSGSERIENQNTVLGDGQHSRAADDSKGLENAVSKSPFLPNGKTDLRIWVPPEAEDMEHDTDSVANDDDDDDDDYYDGTSWGQPSSSSSLDEELGNHRSYKGERKKVLMETMNGQFKILVSRVLASEGIGISDKDIGDNWLDIVTSLSWEAALLIKPDANEGTAMDPGSYIKVKCIASGARSESQVIKGLVFKKNTAHKHMPTKLRNPRLLLLKGSLGQSAVGLSSFKAMEQEDDYKKSFIEMIDCCNPNVVLVERSVPRDILGSLLERGITLVFDVKLHRLERIARCTGSQIICSTDILVRPKLKQCDSFRIEKFVVEHNCAGEGGKKPNKTIMFLDGCPRPLGCTILLKGARSDELKKVKSVVHYTVFGAYHCILETLFFADQRTFFYDINGVKEQNGSSSSKPIASVSDAIPITRKLNGATDCISPHHELDIPISDGSVEGSVDDGVKFNSDLDAGEYCMMPGSTPIITAVGENIVSRDHASEPDDDEVILSDASVQTFPPGQLLPSVSGSLRNFLGENISPLPADSISSYLSFNGKMSNNENISRSLVYPHLETFGYGKKVNAIMKQEGKDNGFSNGEKTGVEYDHNETIEQCSEKNTNEVQIEGKDDIETALDPQSILVLLSTYCIPKHTVCKQTHLSRIKYYGNFDVSLGRYLEDILHSQKHNCSSCGQPPEDHVYRYTHQNGVLTVLVRRLPTKFTLSGEAEGKIWMWTQCLKCEHESGSPKTMRRVLMSSAARGLSFGKFLELSFSSHSAASRLSRCGHLLHRDCLRFFGLGSKVAMFKYTSAEIYAVCKPPQMLEFCNPSEPECFLKEARDVLSKGCHVFMEVADLLKKFKPKCSGALLKHSMDVSDPVIEFDEVEKMLMREKKEFEASLLKAINCSMHVEKNDHEILDLNWLMQELLLMLYIWDRRLHSIFLHMQDGGTTNDAVDEQLDKSNDTISCNKFLEGHTSDDGHEVLEGPSEIPIEVEDSSSTGSHQSENHTSLETKLETEVSDVSKRGCLNSSQSMTPERSYTAELYPSSTKNKTVEEECIPIGEDHRDHMQGDNFVPVLIGPLESVERESDLEPGADKALKVGEMDAYESRKPEDFNLENPKWIWAPFSKLRNALREDLHGGLLLKFEFVNTYSPIYVSPMGQLATQVMDSRHFPIGPGGSVISVIEDEISSIIACALALSEDTCGSSEKVIGNEGRDGKNETSNANVNSLSLNSSLPSPHGSSTGSFEAQRIKSSWSFSSLSSDELATFSSHGSLFADRLIPMENLHPEIPVGSSKHKYAGKSKYSVVCIYAKQFYSLRKKCCSSEMAYISSLSRCRKWDAQGGKSKALFAKTIDDRFIIKQIKKSEVESFLKFGPYYFQYISQSAESGSQTCLARILGIYQVRQHKNGKEVKIDVVIMENLFFGRDISRKYDLKGVVFSRYVSRSNDSESVFLDENFVEDMRISPIYIGGKNKHLLQRAIWNDTSFLTSINVMDYSLLVGVDKKKHKIVFGIIDYLRQYTWDKQLETWVKASLVVPKNELPTVVSPKEYKKRFRNFMTKCFLTVPDTWNSQHCSGCCKFCNNGSNNSSDLHNAKLSEQQDLAPHGSEVIVTLKQSGLRPR